MAVARKKSTNKTIAVPGLEWSELAAGGVSVEEARKILSKAPRDLSDMIIEERRARRAVHP